MKMNREALALGAVVVIGLIIAVINVYRGDAKLREGEAFLAENLKNEGVLRTPSGLQYKVIKEGTGKSPTATSTVAVKYRGTLRDGTEFDNTFSGKEPVEFPVNAVIAGWTEGLQLMKEGGRYQFFIPSRLAYGKGGMPPTITPDEPLIFDVELIAVK